MILDVIAACLIGGGLLVMSVSLSLLVLCIGASLHVDYRPKPGTDD